MINTFNPSWAIDGYIRTCYLSMLFNPQSATDRSYRLTRICNEG